MFVDIMTNNTEYTTDCTNLHPTPTSDPLAKVKLAFCTLDKVEWVKHMNVRKLPTVSLWVAGGILVPVVLSWQGSLHTKCMSSKAVRDPPAIQASLLWGEATSREMISVAQQSPGAGNPYNGLYREAQPKRGTFFRVQVYESSDFVTSASCVPDA